MNETCDRHPTARALVVYVKPVDADKFYDLALCGHCDVVFGPALERQGFASIHQDEIETDRQIDEVVSFQLGDS